MYYAVLAGAINVSMKEERKQRSYLYRTQAFVAQHFHKKDFLYSGHLVSNMYNGAAAVMEALGC